ncbi:MAG TPA: PAS domain S-box protein [Opitutaceae bacterium]|nr:PAS domain S-box protein [Opitutaceae bacterium]
MSNRSQLSSLQLALSYAALGTAWLVFTDLVTVILEGGSSRSFAIDVVQGLAFVGVTTVALRHWADTHVRAAAGTPSPSVDDRTHSERMRRMYATLSAVNRRIIRPTDRTALCQSICDALIDPGAFHCAWIGRLDAANRVLLPLAQAGNMGAMTFPLSIDADSPGSDSVVLRVFAPPQTPVNDGTPRRREAAHGTGCGCGARSCAAIPLYPASDAPMVLVVGVDSLGFFSADTMGMLTELAADLEYGIEAIAEREQRAAAETALRRSENLYRLVTENSLDVIWILSPEGRIQYISPSIERLLGYRPEVMLRMDMAQFLTPESLALARCEIERAIRDVAASGRMGSRLVQLEQIRADGTRVWTELHTTDFYDDSGRSVAILGVTRDITERRAAEQALASEVARCRALLDVSVDGVHVTDLDGQLLDANEIFLRERGFTRDTIRSLSISNWNTEFTAEQVRARQESIGDDPVLFETTHRRADGSLFPVEVRAKRVELDGKSVIYATTRDVTERKALEQRLLRAQRLESVGLIASGIAHDLNNVLTPILLSTGLLEMRYNTAEDRSLLDPIEAAARRGSNIVQQILTFARGADGQRVAVEPKILLKELSTLVRETFPRNITHRLEIAASARAVIGDPTQLHQVFLNLAVNARDAMPDGGTLTIEVRNRRMGLEELRLVPSARPGEYVCIAVIDTGTGMKPEVLDHLFEPFFTTKPRGRGTGLGLSTVHGLVRSHGGFVEVNSRLGRGSEFRVFLPAATETCATPAPASPGITKQFGHGEHILVADDEPAILTVAQSVLRRHGFVPLTAVDGEAAMALLHQYDHAIALVITDVMMPRFDGVRLAAEVRRRYPKLPIVAMSGLIAPSPDDDNRRQLRQLGVTTIINKPYGEPELVATIKSALQMGSG